MKAIIEIYKHGEHEVTLDYNHSWAGRGHFSIILDVTYNGKEKQLRHNTNNTQWIDELGDWKDEAFPNHDEINERYHDAFYSQFEERIADWIYQTLEDDQD
jgi:FKBP-type peptidyl-prolyl cis-trans isomerase 2